MSIVATIARSVRSLAPRAGPISDLDISLADLAEMAAAGYIPWGIYQTLKGDREEIERTLPGLVAGAYRSNGAIFACVMTRFLLFSEARFQFQQMRGGRPGDLFGTPALQILEEPWPGATTGDLLSSQILDVDFAGNGIAVRRPGRIERLRPDWVQLVIGSKRPADEFNPWDPDAQMIGITYQPGGPESGEEPMTFTANEISHYAPYPDPIARFRGMSWITPIIRDIMGDTAVTAHKLAFFENGATPNLIVKSGIKDKVLFQQHVERFRNAHEGAAKAFKTLHLMDGADATIVGADAKLNFKDLQGHGETRIAAAAGIHPAIVGLSEGLQGSALNDGNLRAVIRISGNKTLRPLWRNMAGSLQRIVPPATGSRLWYDDRDIPFLAEDIKDQAEVLNRNMLSIESGIRGGWTPESIKDAVTSGDLRRLSHTGLFSVQLQPAGTSLDESSTAAALARFPEFASPALETHIPKQVGNFRAMSDFTPSSGVLADFGTVPRGTVLPAQAPHVRAFPSIFEPVDAPAALAAGGEVRCHRCGRLAMKRTRTDGGGVEVKCKCGALVAA
jgi:hypothetical protein